jgi:hypothetical protein
VTIDPRAYAAERYCEVCHRDRDIDPLRPGWTVFRVGEHCGWSCPDCSRRLGIHLAHASRRLERWPYLRA